jgi:hypothetical protein
MMFTWEYDKESKCRVRKYVLIASGLTWKEAKELRKTNKNYEIVVGVKNS